MLDLEATRAGVIEVVFMDAATRLPVPWHANLDAVEVGGTASAYMWAEEDGAERMWVERAGRYRLQISPVPGFEPIEPPEVDVGTRGASQVVIKLVRKRK